MTTSQPGGAFTLTRAFDAPRELVWKAWTDASALAQWFGPKGFEARVGTFDLRAGGVLHYAMGAGSQTMWGKFIYREIKPPERLVFVVSFSDPEAGVTRHPMSATWPLEVLSTVEFSEAHGRTTMTMTAVPLNASDEERKTFEAGFESMRQGWAGTLVQLSEYLAAAQGRGGTSDAATTAIADSVPAELRQLTLTRVFEAPRPLVFKAWTESERMAIWWGPKGFTNPVCELDVRPGGAIRIDMRAPDGTVYPCLGTFRDIVEPERLSFTTVVPDEANGGSLFEVLNTAVFTESEGRTTLFLRTDVQQARSGAERYLKGQKEGWNQSLDRLSALLAG